jgi:hypothetical protein
MLALLWRPAATHCPGRWLMSTGAAYALPGVMW